jgi:hypothetical protein
LAHGPDGQRRSSTSQVAPRYPKGQQTRLDVAVGATDSYSVKRSQVVTSAHSRSVELVPAVTAYCEPLAHTWYTWHTALVDPAHPAARKAPAPQSSHGAHARSEVAVAGTAAKSLPSTQGVKGRQSVSTPFMQGVWIYSVSKQEAHSRHICVKGSG